MDRKEQEFLECYENFADAIFRHCYFRMSDREKAKDLMQDTFTRTWKFICSGREVKNIRPFLYQVANNLLIDYYRKKKEVSLDSMQEDGYDPGFDDTDQLENFIAGKQALEIVEELEEPYRSVIVMKYVNDLSISEIAGIMEVSENLVSVRLNRGLRKLREIFNRE